MTDHTTDHFRGRHYKADRISGPISFLNPTTRLLPVPTTKAHPGPAAAAAAAAAAKHTAAAVDHDHDGDVVDDDAGDLKTSPQAPESSSSPPDQRAGKQQQQQQQQQTHQPGVYHIWRSRDNRKGRHALHLTPSAAQAATQATTTPPTSGTPRAILSGLARMLLRYPVWDVSYDVALTFSIGSVVWVINGFLVLLPMTDPGSSWAGESLWGGGVTAMVGATVFELGSVFLMLEAVNENRGGCFGWALEEALGGGGQAGGLVLRRDEGGCRHHHHLNRRAWLGGKSVVDGQGDDVGADDDEDDADGKGGGDGEEGGASSKGNGARRWTWWPSWYEFRTHYFRDIGFLACLSQMIGATIFWIAGITGLPQILGVLTVPATNGIYWLPQVVGGVGFIVSAILFMLETQPTWYTPALRSLGWHIGFWNLIGAIGFTLCGALGFASSYEPCEVALTWSTFIGSWAFLTFRTMGSSESYYCGLPRLQPHYER
ncbi:hypothetical protein VPNG_05440 [Cytospora leucostoma]|uniref:Integral membrane protein n=1 Tax=Cytospora leucostoma TaxID=1230097 RepID=A0A423XBR0_9PEZI|nr:hypothetical protein VPNG_05440 [Cytospora leucostoma]